jgi:Na+/H+ antiporter NhaC
LPDLPYLTFLDQIYVVSYVVTLAAFVLVLWIGRRYGSMEQMADGAAKESLQSHLNRLDELWPFLVVVLAGTAIVACWLSIPDLS